MPWIRSCELEPPLTPTERESLADGKAITRHEPDGIIVICPRSIIASYGRVSGLGITYGPADEDAYYHRVGTLVEG